MATAGTATFSTASNQVSVLKELYPEDGFFMRDLVYQNNPFLALIPKDESPDGFAGELLAA